MTIKTPTTALPNIGDTGWGTTLNSIFNNLAGAIGGATNITVTSSPYTMSSSEAQSAIINVSQSGLSTIFSVYPPAVSGMWIFRNNTQFTMYVTSPTNNGYNVLVNPYCSAIVYSIDGTSLYQGDTNTIPPGSIIAFAGATGPAGYLFCDGSAYSRTKYAALFKAIGTTWGTGDGSTTFNVPNLQGAFLRGSGTSSIDPNSPRSTGTFQAEDYLSHTHTDSGHSHSISPNNSYWYYSVGGNYRPGGAGDIASSSNISVNSGNANIQASGGAETRPDNYAVGYFISHGSVNYA